MIDPLPIEALRWRCPTDELGFQTTADVEPEVGVVGQGPAMEALRFGLETTAPGQNVFVRGLAGTGRMALVGQLLSEFEPRCRHRYDRAYVHNFEDPRRPRLITLERGRASRLRSQIAELADFVHSGLDALLEDDAVKARRRAIEDGITQRLEAITRPFERRLAEADLRMVSVQVGRVAQAHIFPVVDGEPVPPEQLEALRASGKIGDADVQRFHERKKEFAERMADIASEVRAVQREGSEAAHALVEEVSRGALEDITARIRTEFPGEDVADFLAELVQDVVENRLGRPANALPDPRELYGVNIILENRHEDSCPIVIENSPTLGNLLGTVERQWGPQGPMPSDFRMIRGGALLRADGGYLVLDARDLLSEAGAWRVLMRTLRTGTLEIVPPELSGPFFGQHLNPEPIPVAIRVILVGEASTYYVLDAHDPDFGSLFKVLADFESEIDREGGVSMYAGVLSRIARAEELLPFDKTAVGALAEHGARIAARRGRLTARFGRVADIAREADHVARGKSAEAVTGDDVREAVRRTKRRGDLPSRRFQRLIREGVIHVATSGEVVGQVNGLAVMTAGPLTYGFPARITATIGAGNAGIIDVEGRSSMGGSIHTKGFHILGGLLRHLLRADHSLAFSASLAFEQSYGGIDGDSASGAEICCLLSALTNIPLKQSIAMTGSIDQHGRIQAIGGVNEKIEGFFDTCSSTGLTGEQGVIIPQSNAGDLMLREDVVEACEAGQFRVWAVDTIQEALALFLGRPAGELDENGEYPDDSILGIAQDRAQLFWELTLLHPTQLEIEAPAEVGEETGADEEAEETAQE